MNKLILLVCTVLMAGCTATTKEELTESGLKRSDFQTEVNGEKTDLFVLKNKNKMEVCVTNSEAASYRSWFPTRMET